MKHRPPADNRHVADRDVGAAPSGGLRGSVLLLVAGAALGAAIVTAVTRFYPTPVPSASQSQAVATGPRQPSIILATQAAAISAERLEQETEQVAKKLAGRFPDLPEALHVVAMMHAQTRRTAEAEKLWRRCVELAPTNEQFRVNLATVAMDRGDSELAVETLQAALAAGSQSPDVTHHLGVALTNLGRCDEAETLLTKAVAAHPQSASHWVVLGEAQLKLGKAAEAEASLRKAVDLGANSGAVYFALANACARQGKSEAAAHFRAIYARLSESQPLDAQSRFQVLSTAETRRTAVTILTEAAAVHSWQEDSMEAERLLLRALTLDPHAAASCRALADLYQVANMPAEEQVARRRLVELEPQNFDNYLELAKVAAELGEPAAAEAALKLAIAIEPETAAAYAMLARFHLEARRALKARWYAQEAVRREPSADGYMFLASTCRLLGDTASAEAAMAMARKLDPKNPRLSPAADAKP